jgi:uncharacterized pyridoxamine 5'-phosphate oxidase family protein
MQLSIGLMVTYLYTDENLAFVEKWNVKPVVSRQFINGDIKKVLTFEEKELFKPLTKNNDLEFCLKWEQRLGNMILIGHVVEQMMTTESLNFWIPYQRMVTT